MLDSIKTYPKFTIFYVFIMILEVLGLTVIPQFHMVSKAMIMATIMGFYVVEAKPQNHVFLTGLLFALLGDVFLLFRGDDFFIIGLFCFLIMQLCYSSVFNRKRRVPRSKDYTAPAIIVVLGLSILALLWPQLGSLKIGVTVYAFAIMAMAVFGYLRHPKLRGYQSVLMGVLLFVISDALLGINKFSGDIPYGQILVMISYMLAQYFIVTGEVLGTIPTQKDKIKKRSRR